MNTEVEVWNAQVVWKTKTGEFLGRFLEGFTTMEAAIAAAKILKAVAVADGLDVVDCSAHSPM